MAQDIGFQISMIDAGATATGQKVNKTLDAMSKSSGSATAATQSLWKQMTVGLGVSNLAIGAIRGIKNAITGTIGEAASFEASLANVSTLVDTNTVSMGQFETGILDMAGELGSATNLTEGLYQALSAGVEPAKALEFVGTSARFAKAGLTDTFTAVDALSTIINAYGMNVEQAGHVSDILFQTIKDGKTTGEQLAGALGRVIPAAATLKVDLPTVSAALATMTKGGISTEEAVTALNATLMAVIKPSEEAAKTAQQLGIDFSKAGIEGAGGFHPWLIKLKEAVGDNETKMAELFPNVRALKAVFSLAGTQAGEFSNIMERMNDVSGNTAEAFEKQQKTASAAVTAIKNELSAAFTTSLLPSLRSFSSWITENKESIKSVFASIFDGFSFVGSAVGVVIRTLMALKDVIIPVATAAAAMFVIGKIQAWANGFTILSASINAGNISMGAHIALTKAAAIAQKALGLALPIIAVTAAIAVFTKINSLLKDLAGSYDTEIKAIIAHNDVMQQTTERFRDFRDFAGLSSDELKKITADFSHIEDRGIRYNKIMQAIQKGKYGTELAAEFEEWKESTGGLAGEQGKLKDSLDAQKIAIENTKKASEEAKKAYEELAKSMGVLTAQGYQEQSKEIDSLLGMYEQNKDQIQGNEEVIKKWIERIKELSKTALPEEQDALKNTLAGLEDLRRGVEVNIPVWQKETAAFDEFAEFAEPINEEILPDMTVKFQETEDAVKETVKQFYEGRKSGDDLSSTFTSLSTTVSAAFSAIEKLGINLGALPDIMQGVTTGLNSIGSGINAIKNAKSGVTGALSAISGGFSIATGVISAFSSVLKLLAGKSGELEEAERRLDGLSGTTGDWNKKIEELAKSMTGANTAGRAFNALLADIIRSSDVTINNFGEYITRTREIVSAYEQGNASIEETQKNFGSAFQAMLESAQKLGLEGGAAMTGLILEAKEFGLNVKEINDYINSEMKTGLAGWQDSLKVFGGYSVDVYQNMIDLQAKIADNQELIDAIHGADAAMMGLANSGQINETQFGTFQQIAVDAMQRLESSGFSAAQAMESDAGLRGMLQNIIFLSEQYGFKVDDATQALIDQGIASGVLTAQQKSDSEIMQDGFRDMTDAVRDLARAIRGDLSESFGFMGDSASAAATRINSGLSQTQQNLAGVANTINNNVVDAFRNLGDTNDDVMWTHSIIPDIIRWIQESKNISDEIRGNLIQSIKEMGGEYSSVVDEIEGKPLFSEKLTEEYKDKFKSLFNEISETSKVGTANFFEIMSKAQKMGMGDMVDDFKKSMMGSAFESYSDIKDIQSLDASGILEKIKSKEKEYGKAKAGSYEASKLNSELDDLKQNYADVISAKKVFGSTSIGVFEEMYSWQKKLAENKELIGGISSATSMLQDFSKIQQLSEGEYQEFEDIVSKAWKELEGQGFSTNQIFEQLGPMLEKLNLLNKEFGYDVDKNTQSMIDEALAQGKISEETKTDAEKQLELEEKQYNLWLQIARVIGAIPESMNDINSAAIELTEQEKRKNETGYTEFSQLENTWKAKWEEIAASEEMTADFVQQLSDLNVGEGLAVSLSSLIDWVKKTGENIQAGKSWDPESMSFLAGGTGGFKPIRQAIVGEAGPELVQQRNNLLNVIPLNQSRYRDDQGGKSTTKNEFNFQVVIQAAPGGETPETLMKKFYNGWKHDAASIRTKIMKELAA